QLLHRYNMALAQGLLLRASHLELEVFAPEAGRLRQFFRQLKFFRLLATIQPLSQGHYHLTLDGPLSLFDQVRRYGVQFAAVLPAVCHLEQWQLTAEIRPPGGDIGQLVLNQESGLVSHYAISSAYIPPEFERFAVQFNEEASEWTIVPEIHPYHLEANDLIVADFTFRHVTEAMVHLEMFHRWHKIPILRRLQQLQHQENRDHSLHLAIAVDRPLSKDAEIAARLEQSEIFRKHGFHFNEFPSVKRTLTCLESFLS
ncbi:MAG: DUF790 family protein, partial [Magnetococcales bacterium]|nr:DUF790 family protein [Magnetococcales bacterium]